MFQYTAVDPTTLACLRKLSELRSLSTTVLVGGTALALQYGHRLSVDLDFFSYEKLTFDFIMSEIVPLPSSEQVSQTEIMQEWRVQGVKIDILQYPYQFIFPVIEEDGLRIAQDKEIAAMKLAAIANRGVKKDFYDLYALLQRYSLPEIIGYFVQKYKQT
jgi:predicted nucleotidyltransferase component of viral defense system